MVAVQRFGTTFAVSIASGNEQRSDRFVLSVGAECVFDDWFRFGES